jgi:hypothetical protein
MSPVCRLVVRGARKRPSAQTALRVCRVGKPVSTFPDRALALMIEIVERHPRFPREIDQ